MISFIAAGSGLVAIVRPEPVFGQIKQARGFRQFLLRGVEKVANEWGFVCVTHNVLKCSSWYFI